MKIISRITTILTLLLLLPASALAVNPPGILNYQGLIAVGVTPYSGTGHFKFALVDSGPTETFWSNDGTGTGTPGGQPTTAVTATVSQGRYTVRLGDATFHANMNNAVGAGVFTGHADVRLRVWFSTNNVNFELLAPDQPLLAAGYALSADTAMTLAGTLPATQLTGTLPDARLSGNVSLFGSGIDSLEITDGSITANDLNATLLNGTFWKLGGNTGTTPGTHFLGTTDNQRLEFKVNNQRGLRLEYANDGLFEGMNVIGGFSGNSVGASVVGATIAGGGCDPIFQVGPNAVLADFGTVGGGSSNTASGILSTVGGGGGNIASGSGSTVGGGTDNTASGFSATIPGGEGNVATDYAFAAGRLAKATNQGAFVWADSQGDPFSSTGINQFLIRASGGVAIGTNDPAGAALRVAGSIKADSFLGAGATLLLGTTDNQPLEFKVNNQRALRLEYANDGIFEGVNIIGGSSGNSVASGVVGATIAGGGRATQINQITTDFGTVSGGRRNTVSGASATVAGGQFNVASNSLATVSGGEQNTSGGQHATVGGGFGNIASGNESTVGGGFGNIASGLDATLAGGYNNRASGQYAMIPGGLDNSATNFAFAAGRSAKANHDGAFVWADSQTPPFSSTTNDQFNVRAAGGARLFTGGTGLNLDSDSVVFSGSAQTGRFGGAAGFDFNVGTEAGSSGLLIEQGLNESSGIFFDGDSITMWCPGDNFRLLRLYDEDGMVEKFFIDGSGGFSSLGNGSIAGNATIEGQLGIGTTGPSHTLTVQNTSNEETMRLIGPDAVGSGARLNFGDGDFVYLDEPFDDGLRIQANEVGIGKDPTDGDARLQVKGSGALNVIQVNGLNGADLLAVHDPEFFGGTRVLRVGGGALKTDGNPFWDTTSDRRLKQDIVPYTKGLAEIARLGTVKFHYKDEPKLGLSSQKEQIGLIAQDAREVFPEAVEEGTDGYLHLNINAIQWASINAIQELNAKQRELRAEQDKQIGELKAENAALRERLDRLEKIATSLASSK